MFRWILAAGVALVGLCTAALAQQWSPSQRIVLIAGTPPGASVDTLARLLAPKLADQLGQPVVVENRVGGGGVLAADQLSRAPADGLTAMISYQTMITAPLFLKATSFDPLKNFVWLGRVAYQPYILVIPEELKIGSLAAFTAHAKANPGKLNYGSIPNSLLQLDMARLVKQLNLDMTEVPFNGAAPITQALLANQVQLQFGGAAALPQIRAGRLTAIGITGRERLPAAPDVPTTFEQGVEFESSFWLGVALPGGTPPNIVARWSGALANAAKEADVREGIGKFAMIPLTPSLQENTERVKLEQELATRTAKAMGIQPQ